MIDLEPIPPPRPSWPARRNDRAGQDHERKRVPKQPQPATEKDDPSDTGHPRHIDDYA